MSAPQPLSLTLAFRKARLPLLVGAVVLVLATLVLLGYRLMRDDALATLVDFSGHIDRDFSEAREAWRPARGGDAFHDGDAARTAPSASAQFRLSGGALLRLQPDSQVRFQRQRGAAGGALRVDVELGAADVQSSDQAVTLDSEFGPIALDAKSSVRLRRSNGMLEVNVELGAIRLAKGSVAAGEQVTLELGGLVVDVAAPSAPSSAPSASSPAPPASSAPAPELYESADLEVRAGETFVIHDPLPPTRVGVRVDELCTGKARIAVGKQSVEATHRAVLSLKRGQHKIEVTCLEPAGKSTRGNVSVLLDNGARQSPTFTPSATVALDGRQYTVLYQQRLPKVTVTWPLAPNASAFTVTIDQRKIRTQAPTHTLAALSPGKHQVFFTAETTPVRQSRTTTIEVALDTQAPAAQLSELPAGVEEGAQLTLQGIAQPGWSVRVAGSELQLDEQRGFVAKLPSNDAAAIQFSHPSYGTHYYIRRPKNP